MRGGGGQVKKVMMKRGGDYVQQGLFIKSHQPSPSLRAPFKKNERPLKRRKRVEIYL